MESNPIPPPAAFIVGVPRSGTTLLRMMLDSHPQMAIPPETHFYFELLKECAAGLVRRDRFFECVTGFFTWPDFGIEREDFRQALDKLEPFHLRDGLRTFHALYAAKTGKSRWGEKTPDYGNIADQIRTLLPEAHFIHIIRDGRDVALSKRNLWFGPGKNIAAQADDWAQSVARMREIGGRCAHYLEIHYEQLVAAPEEIMRRVCEFLELPFRHEMLEYHRRADERLAEFKGWPEHRVSAEDLRGVHKFVRLAPQIDRVNRWQREMPQEEIELFERIAGPALQTLGYETASEIGKAAPTINRPPARVSGLLFTDNWYNESPAWLGRLRELVDELIIFVDSERASSETLAAAQRVGTRVFQIAGGGVPEIRQEMLEVCSGEWILRLDSDEELGPEWCVADWRELLSLRHHTHFWFPRRWIVPGGFLQAAPWWPDFSLRLFRKDCVLQFPANVHELLRVAGQGGQCVGLTIHHHVLRLLSRAAREEKISHYDNMRPGGALPHYYLFEETGMPAAPLPAIPNESAIELLKMEALPIAACSQVSLRILELPSEIPAGARFFCEVEIENRSEFALSSGAPSPVNLAYHWVDAASKAVVVWDGIRTPLFPPIPSDGSARIRMLGQAPERPGNYLLRLALVQEAVCWFETVHPAIVQERSVIVSDRL